MQEKKAGNREGQTHQQSGFSEHGEAMVWETQNSAERLGTKVADAAKMEWGLEPTQELFRQEKKE